MRYSPLVSYIELSPNKTSPRNRKVDTITIHGVVGQLSVETLGGIFARPARQASSNYGIGSDGRIALYVDEEDRSWCSSNAENDHRAITIECANDHTPPYAINSHVYKSLVTLLVDICERHNIDELKWKADKTLIGKIDEQNLTVHRWFTNTACPGDYIYNKLGEIASDVNKRLAKSKPSSDTLYRVQVGAFNDRNKADTLVSNLQTLGFNAFVVANNEQTIKTIDELAQEVIQGLWGNGQKRQQRLAEAGYDYAAVQKRVNELL